MKIMKVLFIFAFIFYGYSFLCEIFAYVQDQGSWMRIVGQILLFGAVFIQWCMWFFGI